MPDWLTSPNYFGAKILSLDTILYKKINLSVTLFYIHQIFVSNYERFLQFGMCIGFFCYIFYYIVKSFLIKCALRQGKILISDIHIATVEFWGNYQCLFSKHTKMSETINFTRRRSWMKLMKLFIKDILQKWFFWRKQLLTKLLVTFSTLIKTRCWSPIYSIMNIKQKKSLFLFKLA